MKSSVAFSLQQEAEIISQAFPRVLISHKRLNQLIQRVNPSIKMPRQVATLAKFSADRRVAAPSNSGSPVLENNNWAFFEEHPETYMINYEMLARTSWDQRNHTTFLFIGMRNRVGGVTCVKMSLHESKTVLAFISDILDQIDISPNKGADINPPIPFFKNNPNRARDRNTKDTRMEFCLQPDIELATVRGRLVYNLLLGEYELVLNNPVSEAIMVKIKGWVGPCLFFSGESLRNLEAFIESAVNAEEGKKRRAATQQSKGAIEVKKGRYESRRAVAVVAGSSKQPVEGIVEETID